jgi:hypothetical protein
VLRASNYPCVAATHLGCQLDSIIYVQDYATTLVVSIRPVRKHPQFAKPTPLHTFMSMYQSSVTVCKQGYELSVSRNQNTSAIPTCDQTREPNGVANRAKCGLRLSRCKIVNTKRRTLHRLPTSDIHPSLRCVMLILGKTCATERVALSVR